MPESLLPSPPRQNPYEYRAVGIVSGRYYPSNIDFHTGSLVTRSGIIQAVIWSRPHTSPIITPELIENELSFSVYPITPKEQNNALILRLVSPRKARLDIDSYFSIRGNLVAIFDDSFLMKIHRNAKKDYFFYLGILGRLPQEGLKKFWDLECVISGQFLQLVKATLVGNSQKIQHNKTADSPEVVNTHNAEKPNSDIVKQTDRNHQQVTIVKSEITLKFNEIPPADPAANKKVKLILADENENKFMIVLNSKSYKKATEAAASYAKYAGSISGKLTPDGFEVLDAGIKIFEIKSTDQVLESESASGIASLAAIQKDK